MSDRLRDRVMSPRDEARMTLIEHLGELRSRIFKIGVAFVVAAIAAFFFVEEIFYALIEPAGDILGNELSATAVTVPFLTDIKLALYTAFVVTVPILLYQAWSFIAPAVGEVGRLFTYTLISLASLLFLGGIAFGYYLVLPIASEFLLTWGEDRFNLIITADAYLSFVTRFLLAFGVGFEMPAATFVGAKLGLVSAPFMRKYRRHAIVVNAVLAALLTPADMFSMVLLAGPLIVLYEISILIAARVSPFPALATEYDLEEFEEDDS